MAKRFSKVRSKAGLYLAGLVWLWNSAGCGGAANPAARFVPNPKLASAAVATAMEAWQKGEGPGPIPGTAPQLHVMDSQRRAEQILEEFEILGEVPGDAGRCFLVRLKFSNPAAEERGRYIVVGIDPLWIFRHEDYELLSHWDHPMPKDEKTTRAATPDLEQRND